MFLQGNSRKQKLMVPGVGQKTKIPEIMSKKLRANFFSLRVAVLETSAADQIKTGEIMEKEEA